MQCMLVAKLCIFAVVSLIPQTILRIVCIGQEYWKPPFPFCPPRKDFWFTLKCMYPNTSQSFSCYEL